MTSQLYKGISMGFIGMGTYGFTRGFRSEYYNIDKSKRNMLFAERVKEGLVNSAFYVMPVWNIYPLYCLLNRIEIDTRGLNKHDYIDYYKEPLSGHCLDTL
jgi:hypothetical protein